MSSRRLLLVGAGVAILAIAAGVLILRRGAALPRAGSPTYEQVSRAFYHGLAALEVGLLDDARQQFGRATELVAEEPASWANLGLTQLRLGELDAAVAPVSRALELAPDNAEIALLAARMEEARGNVEASLTNLRRAVSLDSRGLRARFALAEAIERSGLPNADADAQALIDELLALAPENLAVLLERTRLAAKQSDIDRLRDSVVRLERVSGNWPQLVIEQYQSLQTASESGRFPDAARATVFLRNVLAPVPVFRESLAQMRTPAELIAEPFERFLTLTPPSAAPAAPDLSTTFSLEAIGIVGDARLSTLVVVPLEGSGAPAIFAADAASLRRVDRASDTTTLPNVGAVLPPSPSASARLAEAREASGGGSDRPSAYSLLALDWNHDFRMDLVVAGRGGLRLLLQGEEGTFTDDTSRAAGGTSFPCDCFGVWAADVEMDGDLDVVVGATEGPTRVLRNNGDGTWRALATFNEVSGARSFGWADLDQDADPDAAFVDAAGRLHVFLNRQAGQFVRASVPDAPRPLVSLNMADINADGILDVLTVDNSGAIRRMSRRAETWDVQEIASSPGAVRLLVADLDNNGAVDVVGSSPSGSRVWLADETHTLVPLAAGVEAEVLSLSDLNNDGRLDLVGLAAGQPVRLMGRGTTRYHWKVVRPRAQQSAGDQRINSFGVGGQIEVRAGLLWQQQVIAGDTTHFGLGAQTSIDVTRIVWPNGVPQAEFGVGVDDTIVAEQRLKGSCPWVFAYDGRGMQFVTDFLWRSPLGLRINAQDTAGVTQTEDWVRIRGDQLVAREGSYDLRVTAELWETHFFDHVALQAVDHPDGTDVFVDERFSNTKPPSLTIHAVGGQRPLARAWDDHGRDVSSAVERSDGRFLATFERGAYQGIAKEHFVELELPAGMSRESLVLLAHGWVYPTDSSINMAIGQGASVRPKGLALEALSVDGRWTVVESDLGYPAGKNKTMVIDLRGVGNAMRLRLRTNLEVYWDSLMLASRVDAPVEITRLPLASAELRYRGYSETTSPRGDAPETPLYGRIANTTQQWRDLVGYYTRFGDVRELLAGVDDRYVIMNAGDELLMRFNERPPLRPGWRRDFVLIGDGWEKDGDFNTGFSQTVLPLPSHDRPDYGSGAPSLTLEHDPVYQRHRDDWLKYHTRYVTPSDFVRGLRPGT